MSEWDNRNLYLESTVLTEIADGNDEFYILHQRLMSKDILDWREDRKLDRCLQRLRKQGLIYFRKKKWHLK